METDSKFPIAIKGDIIPEDGIRPYPDSVVEELEKDGYDYDWDKAGHRPAEFHETEEFQEFAQKAVQALEEDLGAQVTLEKTFHSYLWHGGCSTARFRIEFNSFRQFNQVRKEIADRVEIIEDVTEFQTEMEDAVVLNCEYQDTDGEWYRPGME